MRVGACVAAIVLVAVALPTPAGAAAGPSNEWLALERAMAAPWPALQRGTGFVDYVVAHAPPGPPRDPYGRSFMGLALLQSGLRDHNRSQLGAGLRALRAAARHPIARNRIVFENLALATAYNVARAKLARDPRFIAIRGALVRRLRTVTTTEFGGTRPYYNYYLVDSAAMAELLTSGLRSSVPGSALARRAHTRSLVLHLVNRVVQRVAAHYRTNDGIGRLALLSDPPWNPPAYDAFSLALMARIVTRLGPAVGRQAREVMRRAARALWVLAAPDGSVSYYGRSQDESWTLTMTAYGAEAAAALPGTSRADATRFGALAYRALARLRDDYAGGSYGFWITPALGQDLNPAILGLDRYADAASYSGLTMVGLNWALERMAPAGPTPGPLAADATGRHRVGAGQGALATVGLPSLWYAIKQGPGTFVRGVGDYSIDVRYDSGLVALDAIRPDGTAVPIVPSRPHSLSTGDRAEPLLTVGRATGRFWGTSLRALAAGGTALTGGFRAGARWLRRGVTLRYAPTRCGLSMSIPTRAGDRIEQSLWFRGSPRTDATGTVLDDGSQRVTLSDRPTAVSRESGFASGTEAHLRRLRLDFRGTGKPLVLNFCPAGAA